MSNPNDFIIENGVLKKYTGPGGDVVIPDGVTEIGAFAFSGSVIKTLSFPDRLEIIGSYAFSGQTELEEIRLPNSIKTVCTHAFVGCAGVKTLTLPEGLAVIGEAALQDCPIESIVMPASVTMIQKDAFLRCSKIQSAGPIGSGCHYEFPWTEEIPANAFSGLRGLKKAILPATISRVGNNAFKDCKELAELTMPKTAKVSKSCFKGCDKLEEVKEPSEARMLLESTTENESPKQEFSVVNGLLIKYNGNKEDVSIPEGVVGIGPRAFYGNGTLKAVTIPASVTSIEQEAFNCCYRLEAITISGKIEHVGKDAFGDFSRKSGLLHSISSAIPVEAFTKLAQECILEVFANDFKEYEPSNEVYQANLRFLGSHLKQRKQYGGEPFYQFLLRENDLRHAVLAANAIPAKDLKWLISALQEAGRPDITAEFMDYQNRLLSDTKVQKVRENSKARVEQKALAAELSAADWRKLLKFGYENGDIIIKKVMIQEPIITIPDHIGAKAVRVIATGAFAYNRQSGQTELWSPDKIVLPEGVTEIRYGAFLYTRGTEIFIPSTVKVLPRGCFLAVQNLTLHLRASVEEISDVLALESEEPAIKAIHAPTSSYAEQYAKDHGILFVAEE